MNLRDAETARVYRRSLIPGGWFWTTGQEQKFSLPANGRAQRVAFVNKTFECALRLVAWPKLARCVYRVVEMRNNSYVPLVAGDAEVYVDGARLGRLRIDHVKPGAALVLNLGVDNSFVVERPVAGDRRVETLEEPTRQRMAYESMTTIENRHPTRQVVEVHDHLPHSTDSAVVVEVLAPESAVPPRPRAGSSVMHPRWHPMA